MSQYSISNTLKFEDDFDIDDFEYTPPDPKNRAGCFHRVLEIINFIVAGILFILLIAWLITSC